MKGRRSSALSTTGQRTEAGVAQGSEAERDILLGRAKQIVELRRQRAQRFGKAMFGEPGWDMLLALYIGERHGGAQTIAHLTRFSGLSPALAERWLNVLLAEGLILELFHTNRHELHLTNGARDELERYLAQATVE